MSNVIMTVRIVTVRIVYLRILLNKTIYIFNHIILHSFCKQITRSLVKHGLLYLQIKKPFPNYLQITYFKLTGLNNSWI